MIVAVSTNGEDLESAIVDPRFGRCDNFIIVNTK
ncbi:MAG: dinitrogenase iron-molybdenum cofactor biosynthesis protein, partial [Asgard group archaeon]|nr:dinitrogenase iron-molybdenum cofactor biosynthesis protein [Asgard group archaeon]